MNDRTWDRLSGLLVGATLGFLAGVLLAPSAGQDTRSNLARRTKDTYGQLRNNVTEIGQNLVSRGRSLLKNNVTEIEIREEEGEPAPEGPGEPLA